MFYHIRHPRVKGGVISKLLKEADANIGSAVTYTLFEWVKENLEELLVDQPLNLETCTSHVANLDIDDKVNCCIQLPFFL